MNDFLNNTEKSELADLQSFRNVVLEDSYFDKNVEKAFMDFSKPSFVKKVAPSLLLAKEVGNMYCGTLYGCLASLLSETSFEQLVPIYFVKALD